MPCSHPAAPCCRNAAAWQDLAARSSLLSLSSNDQVATLQTSLNSIITANAITVTFCCLQAFLLSRKSAFYRALREVTLLESSLFLNVRRTPLSVCERSVIWIRINHRTVRLVQTKSSKTAPENQSTDLDCSFFLSTTGPWNLRSSRKNFKRSDQLTWYYITAKQWMKHIYLKWQLSPSVPDSSTSIVVLEGKTNNWKHGGKHK